VDKFITRLLDVLVLVFLISMGLIIVCFVLLLSQLVPGWRIIGPIFPTLAAVMLNNFILSCLGFCVAVIAKHTHAKR